LRVGATSRDAGARHSGAPIETVCVPLMRMTVPLMRMTVPLMGMTVPLMGITVPLMGITVPLIPTACCTASVLGTVAPLAQAVADLHLRMLKRADYDVFDTTMKVPLATRPIPVQMPHGVGRSVLECVRACARHAQYALVCRTNTISHCSCSCSRATFAAHSEPSPGADVATVRTVPLQTWHRVSPVPVQMRHG
jgi:hypothetical protein